MHTVDASDFSEAESEVFTACLEAQERKNEQKGYQNTNVTALYPPGLKSHHEGLLPHEETGSATLRSMVRSSQDWKS